MRGLCTSTIFGESEFQRNVKITPTNFLLFLFQDSSPRFQIKPKIIAVLRSGIRPRRAVRVLLNNRNTKSFDTILADLTNTVKLDTGAVRKVGLSLPYRTILIKPILYHTSCPQLMFFCPWWHPRSSLERFQSIRRQLSRGPG